MQRYAALYLVVNTGCYIMTQAFNYAETVKKMILKSDDPYLAIMSYRSTPHPWCNVSPAELSSNLCAKRLRKAKIYSLIDDTE